MMHGSYPHMMHDLMLLNSPKSPQIEKLKKEILVILENPQF